jgi:flagellar biosynthetic protein FliQ
MSIGEVSALLQGGVSVVLMIAAPLLISALTVGLVVAILQATTSIQEQTLTFVPKVFAILLVLALLGGAGFTIMRDYTTELFRQIPNMAR